MSFFKKMPSLSNSAPTQQQQFPTKSPSQSQQKRQSQPIYPWSAHTPSFTQSPSPFPRQAHALSTTATVAGELFLFGGYVQSSKSVTNDLHMFSTRDFSTALMKTSGQAPNPRYGHCAASTDTTLFIWGGVSNRSDRSAENRWDDDSLYLLNLVSREWTRVVVNGPGPGSRSHHTVTLVGSKLFVFGGRTAKRFFNDIWVFDLNRLNSNPAWESYEPTPGNEKPVPRSNHVSVTTGDRVIIFGGVGVGLHYFNDTWSFDISTREWTKLQCTGSIPFPRTDHAAVLVDNLMYVFGGRTSASDGTALGDLTALNLSTQRWVAFDDIGPSPSRRRSHTMATDGTRIFLLGGTLSPDSKANESKLIYVLDTKRITCSDPDFNAVNSSEKTTQLARESSAGPSIQGQTQLTFSLSDLDVHPDRGNSPLKEANSGGLDHPDSLEIARERNHGSNDLPSLLPGMNDKPRHVLEESDNSECPTDHHGKLVALDDVSSEKEVTRVDHERIADLERQLSETLTAQTERDRHIAQLTDQLTKKSALLEQSEANAAEAKKHAGQELRGLQAKLRTLEQAQSALQKATPPTSDADERSQSACEVRAELEGKMSELEALRLQLMDAEERCAKSKEEADTLRAQNAEGLVNADVDRVMHRLMERMRSMEAEMESMRGNEKSIESMVCRNEG